jgi:hypothetical protein
LVLWVFGFVAFEFDDDFIFDHEIETEGTIDMQPLVIQRQRDLALKGEASDLQLMAEAGLVG